MRKSATFIASLVLLGACAGDDEPPRKESGYRAPKPSTEAPAERSPGLTFTDMTSQAGIDFVHVNGALDRDGRPTGNKYLPETMGSGVVLFDYDSDGDDDILFVQSRTWDGDRDAQPTMKLYRNEGGWKFADATAQAGLAVPCYGMGACAADYDGDGDPDLYVTAFDEDLLFRNDGGRFVRVSDGPDGGHWVDADGRKRPSWTTGAVWFDADGDGDLDLLTVSYVQWTKKANLEQQLADKSKEYTRPQLYTGDRPRLYLQEEGGGFRDATKGSGFDATRVPGKSMAVCLDDFDGDGRMDVFVANDTVQNFLFLNRGGGRFEDVAVPAGVGYDDNGNARASMGIDTVDYRNDGRLAIAIGNFSEEQVSLYAVREGVSRLLFRDEAATARIGHRTLAPLTFGLLMADMDLDGWCDLLLANGHIMPTISKNKPELQYAQPPQYFRNLADGSFADVSARSGAAFAKDLVARGLAAGDLDGDGDLDLVFTCNGGRPLVLRNDLQTKNGSLRLKLEQPGTRNREAIGAVVRITSGGVTQRRVVRTGGSYLSQSGLTLTFGLGAAKEADVGIVWPDGTRQAAGAYKAGLHVIAKTP